MLSNQKETGSQIGQARKLNLGGLGTNLGFELGWTGLGFLNNEVLSHVPENT